MSAQRRRGRATLAIISTSRHPRLLATMGVRWGFRSALPSPRLLRRKGGKRCSDLLTPPEVPNLQEGDYLPDAGHEAVAYLAGVVSVARELLAQGSVLQHRTQYEGPLCKRCW